MDDCSVRITSSEARARARATRQLRNQKDAQPVFLSGIRVAHYPPGCTAVGRQSYQGNNDPPLSREEKDRR